MYREEKMTGNKDFIIQIKGLQAGKHEYEFSVDGSFFKRFENSQILDASLSVGVELEKGGGWMNLNCNIAGTVAVECDRCLDELEIPMNFSASVAVKSAVTDDDPQDDGFIIIDPSEGELDLTQFIYDYICINLPLQKVHSEGGCNTEMMRKLGEVKYENKQEGTGNLPFTGLLGLVEQGKGK